MSRDEAAALPRQICVNCNAETGRCHEDELYVWQFGPLCEECYREGVEQVEESSGHVAAARREGAERGIAAAAKRVEEIGPMGAVVNFPAEIRALDAAAVAEGEPSPCAHEMTSEGGYPHCVRCGGT